ncbi:hypothetical protein, partial [Nonomuraea sp. NPDC048916]|uniref:hypothetical protein n=1 Tax=Nonomuraea sp. NPDC048916 TaxID=3154232 RepID=UPI0033C201FA
MLTVGLGIWTVLARHAPSLLRDLLFSACYTLAFATIIMAVLEVRFAPGWRRQAKLGSAESAEEAAKAKVT